jgi:hypothetical protein
MDKKSAKAALNSALEKVVRTQFADAAIHAVDIVPDQDSDGDPILRITVVYETSYKLDMEKAVGLVRHMRDVLEDKHEEAFPLISFRSKSDHDKLRAAA